MTAKQCWFLVIVLAGYLALMPLLIDPYVDQLHTAIAAMQSTAWAVAYRAVHPKRYHP